MTLEELLKDDFLTYPKSYSGDYIDFLKNQFSDYLSMFSSLSTSNNLDSEIKNSFSQVKNLTDGIVRAIRAYLEGQPTNAFEILSSVIKSIKGYDGIISIDINKDSVRDLKELFRIRVEYERSIDKPSEMFHIPFEMREIVTSQRYSIPGLPCLYFGSSLYIAWKEMDKPPFDSLYLAKAEVDENVRVLNLALPASDLVYIYNIITDPANVSSIDPKKAKIVKAWILLWPLLLACSVRKNSKGPFIIEYIIPQLVMQFIRKENIDGIRYVSTKDEGYGRKISACWAFPAKTFAIDGHCSSLKRIFKITAPLGWQISDAVPTKQSSESPNNAQLQIIPGVRTAYGNTKFGKLEQKLKAMDVHSL